MSLQERAEIIAWEKSVIFRKIKKEDVDELLEIEKKSFPSPWSREMFLRELEVAFSYHRLIELKGKKEILGYIFCWLGKDEASILSLAVAPKMRGKGLGSFLLKKALDELFSLGILRVWLEVRVSNLPAQALYRKFGFKLVGIRRGYYRDTGEDALVMEKELKDAQSCES